MNLRISSNLVRFICVAILLVGSATSHAQRPNIIYILADDLGYGDLGCYGSKLNSTPNIDALAANGVRLTDFHAASWCAPSRRALMTGCHAHRPWNDGDRKRGRLADAVTIPEMLRDAGYRTAMLGKWHLEMSEGLHPLDQGFESWVGTRGSNDWDGPRPNYASFRDAPESAWKTPLHVNRENKGPIVPQSLFTNRYTEEAVRLINEFADSEKPFFLYLAHNMPHVPIFASEQFRGKSKNGVYGDVIAELDWSVGQIVAALKKTEQLEETIVIFTSDNGPWTMFSEFGGTASPLRGEKSTTWEGGERVPCIVSWPSKIKPAVSSQFMVNYDMYATLAKLTASQIPQGHAIDSLDMAEVLLHGAKSPRQKHVHFFRQPTAFRNGDYKIHLFTRERTRDPATGKAEPSIAHEPPLLFNVREDPSEQHNLASKHPDIVQRMQRELENAVAAIENWEQF